MAKLAIKGHKTRGKEVIEILKMLGGITYENLSGVQFLDAYYITDDKRVEWKDYQTFKDSLIFSLEEFLEKFPYKVGDKISSKYLKNYKIEKMEWEDISNKVIYKLQGLGWYSVDELQPYKEEDMETITIDDFKANTKEWLIDKLGNMSMNDALQTINNIYNELHRPQYPKTYKECCKVVNASPYVSLVYDKFNGQTYSYDIDNLQIYENIRKLKICRDAYWKIAGEEMGLGKPWEPDWTNTNSNKYCIYFVGDEIKKQPMLEVHHFLAFPTKEMRDAFYENFKDLIEQCKEFL